MLLSLSSSAIIRTPCWERAIARRVLAGSASTNGTKSATTTTTANKSKPRPLFGVNASSSLKSFSSFPATESVTSTTTKVSPTVLHGPYGSGGTVVGFSKYDGVRYAFEKNFAERLELGAQLVVYERGKKVVDLYGYAPELENEEEHVNKTYDGDTLQCVWSSGKNMEAIALAMLVDRGLVAYEDLVSKHWPEFGVNGKQDLTVADVMRHSGGVPFVVDPDSVNYPEDTIRFSPQDVADFGVLEARISAAEKWPPPGAESPAYYHALSRGWIVNGILRRVDPEGRSVGNFMREEITNRLGVSYFCGLSKDEQTRTRADCTHSIDIADFSLGSPLYNAVFRILPALSGYRDSEIAENIKLAMHKDFAKIDWGLLNLKSFPPSIDFFNTVEGRSLEISSANMVGNARSMAKINAAMAGDGSIDGIRLLSERGVEESMDEVVSDDFIMPSHSTFGFSKGGFCSFKHTFLETVDPYHKRTFHPDDKEAYGNFQGWGGMGGSMSLWDRGRDISFAYCMTAAGLQMLGGKRTRRILLELQKATE
mmetsp:Transcript_5697/g.12435  ORF Transcript_5697/g.12435 Transcript_5697/m.12435 type:complete len:538 (-) Transcript_5697:41-1654(-)